MATEKGRKIQTIYTKENYQIFNRVHYQYTLGKKKYGFLLFVILTLPLIIFYLFNGTTASIGMILFFSIIDIVLLIEVYSNVLPDKHTKRTLKRDPSILELVNIFHFYQEYFEIKNSYATSKINYDKLHHVIETDNFFYLYQNKVSAFLIEKNMMKKEDIVFLHDRLKEVLKKQYFERFSKKRKKTSK